MIKFVVAAVWIVAVTLGTVYFSFQHSAPKPVAAGGEEAAKTVSLDYLDTEIMSIPVVRDGEVIGYFLTKLGCTVDKKVMAKLTIPANTVILDAMFTYLFGSPEIDFTDTKKLDLNAFKANIKDSINKKVGEGFIQDIAIEQVEYLTKDEIRDTALRRKMAPAEKKKKQQQAEAAEGGHGGEGEAAAH